MILTMFDKPYEVAENTSVGDLIKAQMPDDFKKYLAVKLEDGTMVDLFHPIEASQTVAPVTFDDPEGRKVFFHSASHLMAMAVKHLFPQAKLAIGPAIADGFYYDFDTETPFTMEDLAKIEKEMQHCAKKSIRPRRYTLPRAEAIAYMQGREEPYKVQLIEDLPEDEELSFYEMGDFTDLCVGPHLPNLSYIKAFKLTHVAGAYWRGDEHNKMLCRIYATAFPTKEQLQEHLDRIEEAKKRDHRKLGRELDLFDIRDEGPGFPFFYPKGMILRNILEDYWHEIHRKAGYEEIKTPIMLNRGLWERSGHWDHYKENMYTTKIDDTDFAIKPMNCPGSILVYELEPHSYKELPLRFGELGLVHRHELSGALHGMFRVRCFTQDDAHILLAKDQIQSEVTRIAQLLDEVYSVFGLSYKIVLSTMPEDHIGTREDWEKAENALADAITSIGKEYELNPGDGAFYGPKLDFHVKDSLGRTWQCGTIQLDYQLPGRFNLEYTGSDGQKHTPVMIHRVVFGSIERFIGVITEHFAGKFPLWLAPVQVKLLTVTEKFVPYAKEVAERLEACGIRVELDDRNEKIGYKLREARNQRVNYICVIGEREAEAGTLTVRSSKAGELGEMSAEEFTEKLLEEIKTKAM